MDLKIGIFGTSNAGKTVYLAMLTKILMAGRERKAGGWWCEFKNERSREFLEDKGSWLDRGEWPPGTTRGERVPIEFILRKGSGLLSKSFRIESNDIAGEDFEALLRGREPGRGSQGESPPQEARVSEIERAFEGCEGFLLLIKPDPKREGAGVLSVSNEALTIDRLCEYLAKRMGRGRGRIGHPTAFVFTKADMYAAGFPSPEGYAEENLRNTCHAIRTKFRNYRYFFCSATGVLDPDTGNPRPERLEPEGVLEPLQWVVGEVEKGRRSRRRKKCITYAGGMGLLLAGVAAIFAAMDAQGNAQRLKEARAVLKAPGTPGNYRELLIGAKRNLADLGFLFNRADFDSINKSITLRLIVEGLKSLDAPIDLRDKLEIVRDFRRAVSRIARASPEVDEEMRRSISAASLWMEGALGRRQQPPAARFTDDLAVAVSLLDTFSEFKLANSADIDSRVNSLWGCLLQLKPEEVKKVFSGAPSPLPAKLIGSRCCASVEDAKARGLLRALFERCRPREAESLSAHRAHIDADDALSRATTSDPASFSSLAEALGALTGTSDEPSMRIRRRVWDRWADFMRTLFKERAWLPGAAGVNTLAQHLKGDQTQQDKVAKLLLSAFGDRGTALAVGEDPRAVEALSRLMLSLRGAVAKDAYARIFNSLTDRLCADEIDCHCAAVKIAREAPPDDPPGEARRIEAQAEEYVDDLLLPLRDKPGSEPLDRKFLYAAFKSIERAEKSIKDAELSGCFENRLDDWRKKKGSLQTEIDKSAPKDLLDILDAVRKNCEAGETVQVKEQIAEIAKEDIEVFSFVQARVDPHRKHCEMWALLEKAPPYSEADAGSQRCRYLYDERLKIVLDGTACTKAISDRWNKELGSAADRWSKAIAECLKDDADEARRKRAIALLEGLGSHADRIGELAGVPNEAIRRARDEYSAQFKRFVEAFTGEDKLAERFNTLGRLGFFATIAWHRELQAATEWGKQFDKDLKFIEDRAEARFGIVAITFCVETYAGKRFLAFQYGGGEKLPISPLVAGVMVSIENITIFWQRLKNAKANEDAKTFLKLGRTGTEIVFESGGKESPVVSVGPEAQAEFVRDYRGPGRNVRVYTPENLAKWFRLLLADTVNVASLRKEPDKNSAEHLRRIYEEYSQNVTGGAKKDLKEIVRRLWPEPGNKKAWDFSDEFYKTLLE